MAPTRYNPDLILTVDGVTVAHSADAAGALLAVEEVVIPWGRTRLWEHQPAAQATFTLLDRTGAYGPNTGTPLLQRPVTIAWSAAGTTVVNFRGRISDVTLTVNPPDPLTGAFAGNRIEVTATSMLAQAETVVTEGASWAAQNFPDRWAALRAYLVPSLLADALYPSNAAARALAARASDGEGVLGLLRGLLDSAPSAPRMIYNPGSNLLGYVPRRSYSAPGYATLAADPVNSPDGRLLLRAANSTLPALDAAEFTGSGALTRSLDGWTTGVEVTHPVDAAASARSTVGIYDAATETATGPNRMSLTSDVYLPSAWSDVAADWLGMMTHEGRRWHPEPITHLTREVGGLTWDTMRLCLDGVEWLGTVYLNRSPWVLTGAAPYFAIIGGTIRYADGWWSPTVQLAPVDVTATVSTTPVSAATAHDPAHPVTAATLSAAVSFADMRFWTTTYTG